MTHQQAGGLAGGRYHQHGVPVARSDFKLSWNLDATAHVGGVRITSDEGDGDFVWMVVGPPSITSFTPFVLPSSVAPITTFPAGRWRLDAFSMYLSSVRRYGDFLQANFRIDRMAELRQSSVRGHIQLP